jgi:hypothetical protein
MHPAFKEQTASERGYPNHLKLVPFQDGRRGRGSLVSRAICDGQGPWLSQSSSAEAWGSQPPGGYACLETRVSLRAYHQVGSGGEVVHDDVAQYRYKSCRA